MISQKKPRQPLSPQKVQLARPARVALSRLPEQDRQVLTSTGFLDRISTLHYRRQVAEIEEAAQVRRELRGELVTS